MTSSTSFPHAIGTSYGGAGPSRLRSIACGLWCSFCLLTAQDASPNTSPEIPPPRREVPAPSPAQTEKALRRGIDFLLRSQNSDGSWGSARKTKDLNIFAPVPGAHDAFRSATTALCILALIEGGQPDRDPKVLSALQCAERWLLEQLPHLRRADSIAIYNVWGHAYGIQALAAMHRRESRDAQRRQRIMDAIQGQVELLGRYESVDGGWGYYDFRVGSRRPATDSTSFVTATVLVAFHAAKEIGASLPAPMLKRGIDSINRQRKTDHSYLYGEYLKWSPMRGINRPAGSLGRSQACNLALRMWGDTTISEEVFVQWLDRLIARNGWLSIGRKRPVPHEAWFQVAAYFFYYGHYYAALCTDYLAPPQANHYRAQLAGLLLPLQEKDGSWWDFPFYNYHQPYGTAYAILTLQRCLPRTRNRK